MWLLSETPNHPYLSLKSCKCMIHSCHHPPWIDRTLPRCRFFSLAIPGPIRADSKIDWLRADLIFLRGWKCVALFTTFHRVTGTGNHQEEPTWMRPVEPVVGDVRKTPEATASPGKPHYQHSPPHLYSPAQPSASS